MVSDTHTYFFQTHTLVESNCQTLDAWELAVRKVYEQHVLRLQKQMLIADTKAVEMGLNVQDFHDQIQRQEEEKQNLSNQVSATKQELANVHSRVQTKSQDMEATRKNYDGQLGMLTEHICALSARLSEKDASLASLQANKVLCGRCGMWNTMGQRTQSDRLEALIDALMLLHVS
eukprot:g12694.t1